MAVRPRRHPSDVQRGVTETQNMKKRKLICDVLTGIPASKATEGSEGKMEARGSLPQRHTLECTMPTFILAYFVNCMYDFVVLYKKLLWSFTHYIF